MLHNFLDINEKHRDDNNEEVLKYQNSYQLEPYNIFKTEHMDNIISAMIIANLECNTHNNTSVECAKLSNKIATNILTQIQKLQFGRYQKYIPSKLFFS